MVHGRVRVAAVVGFVVPILWGIASFILFNARESIWTKLYWAAVYLTCPFWVLPGITGELLMPFLNAGLYAVLAFLLSVALTDNPTR
jgi:hypothetical protein